MNHNQAGRQDDARDARSRITRAARQWCGTNRLAPVACVLIIAALNIWITRELFVSEYINQMGSIESTHITLGRWVSEHSSDLSWFPLWYGGVPFLNTYPPIGPWSTATLSWIFDLSPALAYHAVTAFAYCLGPVLLFVLAYVVSGAIWPSLLAALAYSVFSPSALLIAGVAKDVGGLDGARRLQALVVYGEGPHIISLTLIPLAIAALHQALQNPKLKWIWLASIAVAAVPLTNWIGATALAGAVLAYMLTTLGKRWYRPVALSILIGVLAYAVASPWIPPSSVFEMQHNAQEVVGEYPMNAAQFKYCGILLALVLAGWGILQKLRVPRIIQFSFNYCLLMAGISVSRLWFGDYAVPQPERFHLEFEIGAVLLGVFVIYYLARKLPAWGRTGLVVVTCLAAVLQAGSYRDCTRRWVQPIDVTTTVEFEVADWLNRNLPGRRVYATGSTQFWLNVFSDIPQLGGAADQAMVNMELPAVKYGIPFTQGTGEETVQWLKAYGIDAIVVGGPDSRDAFHDYHDPAKFEGVIPAVWRDGDDAIYRVPRRTASLAHVLSPEHLLAERPPAFDRPVELRPYLDALEDPMLPPAQFTWQRPGEAVIRAEMDPSQVLSVQVSYHPKWRARVDGRAVPVRRDGLGQIVVEPDCDGYCEVQLQYDPGTELAVARIASGLTLLVPLAILLYGRVRKKINGHPSKR